MNRVLKGFSLKIKRTGQAGFTIVEMMVATVVFGLVLLVVTTAIIQFSRVYYKGLTESDVQNTTRTVTDLIAQGIQFSGGAITEMTASPTAGNSYAFCVGNQQYSYTTGYQLNDAPQSSLHQSYHALVVNEVAGCTSSTAAQNVRSSNINGRELLSPGMRLARLQVTNVRDNLYKISIRIVYGDDDLLSNPTTATAKCQSAIAGTQFWAVTDLTVNVVNRIK